jgi:glycosyltransferase involved in cell wall biosynthesis
VRIQPWHACAARSCHCVREQIVPNEATPYVSTIIATMAAPERSELVRRAVLSVRRSSTLPVTIIVVVNGKRSDPELVAWLRAQHDVRLEILARPSLPHALLRGRELVRTPYFSTLDDDDEYLGNAIDLRLEAIRQSGADVVVTNGFRYCSGTIERSYDTLGKVPANPLEELFRTAWLHNGNALYRSDSVGSAFFTDHHAYAEWTWLAYKLALAGKRIAVLETPTFIYYDTPGSLSKSAICREAYMSLYRRMLDANPPPAVVRHIKRRIQSGLHDQSCYALDQGRRLEALRFHLCSLTAGGLRYFSFGRRLLPGWPKRVV